MWYTHKSIISTDKNGVKLLTPKKGGFMEPSLYGIEHSNRTKADFWGKNQFNSSFPVSLACYMRDRKIKPVYIKLNNNLETEIAEIDFNDVFRSELPNNELYFSFESKFEPYQRYSHDDIQGIDLVVKDTHGNFLAPLEIKLTVLPDHTTKTASEEKWGSELVIRPATTKYIALGIINAVKERLNEVRDMFEPVYIDIQDWSNRYEIANKIDAICNALNVFQREFHSSQRPVLMQTIWKTEGQSPFLAENAFDVFVWSDFALSRVFINGAKSHDVTRLTRSAARLCRILYEISALSKIKITKIYTEMAFEHQTDKEFAVSGIVTREYMRSDRKTTPIIKKEALKNIILNGGEKMLRPERRFDQTVYFTMGQQGFF
jgi:hypothetical protein